MEHKFKRIVNFFGRNGYFKSSGISITTDHLDNLVSIEPITSKGNIGRCRIEIPIEDIPNIVSTLNSYYGTRKLIEDRAAALSWFKSLPLDQQESYQAEGYKTGRSIQFLYETIHDNERS